MKKPRIRALRYKTYRISYITNYILIVLLIVLLFLFPYFIETEWYSILFYICLIIALYLLFEPEWERVMRKYQITNNEVTKIEGIITKKEISIPHINIVDIKVVKGVIGRIFDFGDITVRGVKDEINMKGMRDPEVIYRIIKNKITLIGKPKVKVKKEKKKK